jgi:hypothetical protein
MSGNAQKTPFVKSLNDFVEEKGRVANQLLGKAFPASVVSVDETNTIVTIKFEMQSDIFTLPQVTCPVFGPRYIRYPLQPGDKGLVLPSDFYLGGMSGLGGGTAQFEQQSNLSNLVFFPIGNTDFEPVDDPTLVDINGPEGVALYDDEETVIVILKKNKGVEINAALGGNTLKANWVEASSDAEAKSFGIPYNGLYKHPDGSMKWQRIPD